MSPISLPLHRLAASYARSAAADASAIEAQHSWNAHLAAEDGFEIPESPMFRLSDNGASPRLDCDRPDRDPSPMSLLLDIGPLGMVRYSPALRDLMTLVMSRHAPFSRVYIRDPSRLGRYPDHRIIPVIKALFEHHGIEIIYNERRRPPATTPAS